MVLRLPFFLEDTMSKTLLELAHQLTEAGEPFVLATVVWCERPTSAKPGAQALIRADGQVMGWIGGSCAQPVVMREAARILREGGDPYLLRLGTSDTGIDRKDVRNFPMSCSSGGVLDIFMEPHFPLPKLVLIGESPVVVALSQLAQVIDFSVTQLLDADLNQVIINEQTCILVASHGQYDEEAVEQALRSRARYVGMVSSLKRAEACRAYLRDAGLSAPQIARLKAPAGLDIGALTPDEIAASVLAELVQVRRRGAIDDEGSKQGTKEIRYEVSAGIVASAIDPVCGMEVEIANARHHSNFEGRTFYFCCPACKRSFERNPQEYLVQHER
ncbi:MAG: YHS domain-containing protein [Chloroflexota bacterium]|nr:MAG: YHS domain-containing protein [Chloroflexota bacterium]